MLEDCLCYLTCHDYPSLVEGESHSILLLQSIYLFGKVKLIRVTILLLEYHIFYDYIFHELVFLPYENDNSLNRHCIIELKSESKLINVDNLLYCLHFLNGTLYLIIFLFLQA